MRRAVPHFVVSPGDKVASQVEPSRPKRIDAERNRQRIITAARDSFDGSDPEPVSMAEVARRAGVGMATLYRNFPGRRQLLEAIFTDDVEAVCSAASSTHESTSGATLRAWLARFFDFAYERHDVAVYLIAQAGVDDPLFRDDKAMLSAAGQPLLEAAQRSGEIREDVAVGQILDLLVAIAGLRASREYVRSVVDLALDGLRPVDRP